MKTLKITAIKLWNAIAKTIGLLIGLLFPLTGCLGIIVCCIVIVQFGVKLWFNHSHVAYWIITGVMWFALGFAIWVFNIAIKDMIRDIKNRDHIGADIAKNLSIKL